MRTLKTIVTIAVILALGLIGAKLNRSHEKDSEETRQTINGLEDRIQKMERNNEILWKVIEADPKLIFAILDSEIENLENDHQDRMIGSFTDFFTPELSRAKELGASKEDILLRLDRVEKLAMEGKYYSSFLEEVAKSGENELAKLFASTRESFLL